MKLIALYILSIVICISDAFNIYSSRSPHQEITSNAYTPRSRNIHHLSTTEINDGKDVNRQGIRQTPEVLKEESWQIYLESSEVQEVRQQLIEKYLSLGRSQEYAEVEIDNFLNDPDRSRKFLEMKKYVKSQKDASMGFENFFFYGGAFFVGLLGDAVFKNIQTFQELHSGNLFNFS